MTASGDVSLDGHGVVYVADFGASLTEAGGKAVYRLNADGSGLARWSDGFGGASGNEFGNDGSLYQSDVARGEVWKISPDGTRVRIASDLESPVGVTQGRDGRLFVAECTPKAITRIDLDGNRSKLSESGFLNCPNGLTFGPDGKLYTANFLDGALVRVDPDSGQQDLVATVPGGGNGHVASANNRLYVASFKGGQIYSVTTDGKICHIAGNGSDGNQDGNASEASFFRPNGVAISADGNSLFTNTVTKILPKDDKHLHPNALRRIDGLLGLLDCAAQ